MPDLCPICNGPLLHEPEITEDSVLYDALVDELGIDPQESAERGTQPPTESRALRSEG